MCSTRYAPPGAPLNQSRFSSSVAFNKGLLGNLVAKRAKLIESPEDRALIYFLQQLSHREGGLQRVARELVAVSPQSFYATPNPGDKTSQAKRQSSAVDALADRLQRLCLDPAIVLNGNRANRSLNLLHAVGDYRKIHIKHAEMDLASTSIAQKVYEDLEFALQTKSLVLIEGLERIGKTATALNFCARHPGQAVYVRLESGNDDTSFFRSIAKPLGITSTPERQAIEMRLRIEDMLQCGHLMLVMDEAHFLWPQTARARRAPSRVDWIRTALVDFGVPLALISTPQFDRQCQLYEKQLGWNSRQLKGRVALHTRLPTTLSEDDLKAIASHLLPDADAATILRLVGFAQASDDYVAGIERVIKRARFFAQKHGT